MPVLADLLRRHEAAIAKRWLARILASYSPDTAAFLRQQQNRFANPVGRVFAEQAGAIVAGLFACRDAAALRPHLEEIIRIRAIQEFTAGQAVAFVFLLKDEIRETVADARWDPEVQAEVQAELHELEVRIDQIALLTFDIFVSCREKVYSLRLREIRAGYVQPG